MSDSEFWRNLALSFRQLRESCADPLNVEWNRQKRAPIGARKSAWAVFGDGAGRPTCSKQFLRLAEKASQKLAPRSNIETWLSDLSAHSIPSRAKDEKRADTRLEDVIKLSAERCERIAETEGAKEMPTLANLVVPSFRYFPTHLMEKQGPKQWSRLRLLQACERLDIPKKLWPKIPIPELPRQYIHLYHVAQILRLPNFLPLYESEAEWRSRVQQFVDKFVDQELDRFRKRLASEVKDNVVTRIQQKRDTTPLDLRYEWAASRICYRTSFPELAKQESAKGYTKDRIKQAVNTILKEADLGKGK